MIINSYKKINQSGHIKKVSRQDKISDMQPPWFECNINQIADTIFINLTAAWSRETSHRKQRDKIMMDTQ